MSLHERIAAVAVEDAHAFETLASAQADLLGALDAGQRSIIWSSTHTLCHAIEVLERDGVPRGTIASALAPVRQAHAESPFVRRLQTWPRGYPGDFETIEYLVGGTNLAPRGTRAWWVEQVALTSLIAVQHRCKVRQQAEEIRRVCAAKPGARVLMLACGGGRDLQVLLDEAATLPGAHLTLVDQDADAVALAADRAHLLGASVTPLCTDVLRGVRRTEGPFDLVLAGGLFDYLEDATITLLLKAARRKMAARGVFFFTNIAAGNPFRVWIEYLGDWRLIEREHHQIEDIVADAGWRAMSLRRDVTALSMLVRANAEPKTTLSGTRLD